MIFPEYKMGQKQKAPPQSGRAKSTNIHNWREIPVYNPGEALYRDPGLKPFIVPLLDETIDSPRYLCQTQVHAISHLVPQYNVES